MKPTDLLSPLPFAVLTVGLLLPFSATRGEEDSPSSLPPTILESSPLGEELELLEPRHPRDEKQQDRVHAASLFAHGRLLQNREQYAGALGRYQRAWRYHPQQVSILESIVPLAFELKRNGEAARYAVLAAERNPQDSALLRRLAMYLTQQEEYERAAALYESAVELGSDEKTDVSRLVIRMELGRLYLLMEEYQKSAEAFREPAEALENPQEYELTENFKKVLIGEPDRTYQMLGESFVQAGMYDRAEKAFRQLQQTAAEDSLIDYSLARVAAGRKQDQKALEHLEKYFKANASTSGLGPYELYAEIIARDSDSPQDTRKQVLSRLQPLRKNDPANVALGIFVARQLATERPAAARKVYEDLLTVAPSLEAYNGLIELMYQQRDVPALLSALGQAVAQVGDLESLEASTTDLLNDQPLIEDLLAEAERRLAQSPEKLGPGVALAAGLLAMEAEEYEKVKPLMTRALEEGVPAKSAIVSQWGLGLIMADQNQAAAEVFQMAIDTNVDPENNAAYYYYLASALGMDKQFDQAQAAARKAAELRPIPRFESRSAWLYYYAKQYDKAAEEYQKILDQYGDEYGDPNVRDVVRDARLVLSTIALENDDFEQAVEYLELVLDEFPEDIGARNDLGYLWADENVHLQRAHEMLQEVVAAQPDNKAYRDSLGWVLYRLGRYEEAIVELELAAAGEDPDGVMLDHLADVYWAAGKHAKAKELWQQAIAAFQQSEEKESVKEVRQKLAREP